jgi:hypothetical protein
MELILKLSGILLGVLARTLVPYLRKLKQGKITEFQNKYWLSAVASLGLGIITTILIFPKFEITQIGQGTEALVKLFCLAFGFGYAWNSVVSEGIKWIEKK